MTLPQTTYVRRVTACELSLGSEQWQFARDSVQDIEAHWQRRRAENPSMFNGVIHLMTDMEIRDGVCRARFLRTDFRSYLFWRERGFPETGVRDGFGSALLRSADGKVVLGRQRSGNLNAGLAYLPGGFIDERDVTPGGGIDIEGSIARELVEETGVDSRRLKRMPGYILTVAGSLLSIAADFRSELAASELCAAIKRHLSDDADAELADVVAIGSRAEIADLPMPLYAPPLLNWLFSQASN